MTSYLTSMDTISLSRTVFDIFDFEVFRVRPWPLTREGHLGSKNCVPFESPYMNSYLTSMDNISLTGAVFEIFNFKVFRVWPRPLTPKSHLRFKKFYTIRKAIYHSLFDFYGQHISISYRFRDIGLQSFQGSTLTFDPWRSSGVKIVHTIRKPICDFLFDFHGHHISISYRSRDIRLRNFQGLTLNFDPQRSSGVAKFHTIWKPIYEFLFDSMNNISPSRTVFEIFDFKVFWVWPWPLNPKGHLGSNKIIPFESPYITSYLTLMDNISPSRAVLEIFDFEVFRVRPWPLTPKGHLGSNLL